MKTALLFAGQGSQRPGMGKDFYENYEEFRQVFNLLPEEQRRIAFEGPDLELKKTINTQPILLAFGIGVWKLLEKEGFVPEMVAGLSLGEYSALCAAGVFSTEEAVDLIAFRAQQMAAASEGVDAAMSAILNLDRETVQECCREAETFLSQEGLDQEGEIAENTAPTLIRTASTAVEIANYNCRGQIVIAGNCAAVAEAEKLAQKKGARRTIRIKVSGPFHTAFMNPAAEALAKRFKNVSFGEGRFSVLFNCIGREKKAEESVADLLVRQVCSSVYFEDTIYRMAEAGIDTIVEIGPGKALSGFVRKTCMGIKTFNIDTVEDFQNVVRSLKEKNTVKEAHS